MLSDPAPPDFRIVAKPAPALGNTLPFNNNPPVFNGDEDKKELKLIERLLQFNLGVSILLGGILFLLVVLTGLVLVGKLDLLEMLKNSPQQNGLLTQITPTSGPKLADSSEGKQIFITDQIVELKGLFDTPVSSVRITLKNKLKKEVFGFLPYWAVDESDQIPIDVLTSVAYFGLEVDGNGNIVTHGENKMVEPWQRWYSDKKLATFYEKLKKNRIKTHVVLKSFHNGNIEQLVQSGSAQINLINNALYLMNSRSLDGINLDFEYVGTPDEKIKNGFSLMVSNLNKELKKQYPKAMLTVCTYVAAASTNQLHDVEVLAQNSDGLIIMAYDFHTIRSSKAGALAPMEGYGINLKSFMNSYLEKVPPEKLILAVGYYGYDWPVVKSGENAEVSGITRDVKAVPYGEIIQATKQANIQWNDETQSPWYSYLDPTTGQPRIVHFENARSLGIKYDFVKEKNLGGIGIWALGYDGKETELQQLISDKFAY